MKKIKLIFCLTLNNFLSMECSNSDLDKSFIVYSSDMDEFKREYLNETENNNNNGSDI